MANTFQHILEKYRKISFSEKDKGERFERLMKAYLLTDPKYAYKFKKVRLWSAFPYRMDLGGTDTFIDPRYILDLLLSIINVSVQTVEIVNSLSKVKFE